MFTTEGETELCHYGDDGQWKLRQDGLEVVGCGSLRCPHIGDYSASLFDSFFVYVFAALKLTFVVDLSKALLSLANM